jgi:protein required for attachment to host cells
MIHALVADTRTIRVFEGSPPARALAEVAVFHNEAAGRHERDLVSDRPGRVINTASGMHQAYEAKTRATRHSMQTWLKAIGAALEDLLQDRSSDGLVLVAAPRMLAQLRKSLPASVCKRVAGELPVDLVRQPLADLKKRVQPALTAAARTMLRAQAVHPGTFRSARTASRK